MSGIVGILFTDESKPLRQMLNEISKMAYKVEHRGPDDSGFWSDGKVALGIQRQSIIDSYEGNQPLSNESGSNWIVFDGEIYNYKEIRRHLEFKNHRFKTQSDTEVIVHLYEEYGSASIYMLRGMFSFAIWDCEKQLLFAARDHFGIKPFYYFHNEEKFVFASEIKSILTVDGINTGLKYHSLYNYLSFQCLPQQDTMFEGINKLNPGHTLTVHCGRVTLNTYWNPMFEPYDKPIDVYIEEIHSRLSDSVKHHMLRDVSIGGYLSSEIESTALAAYMSMTKPIKTFSVGYEGGNTDSQQVSNIARQLGTQHFSKTIDMKDYFSTVPAAIWHLDEPIGDPTAISLFLSAELAKGHVNVVLSGEGANELFGGFGVYKEPSTLRYISWLPISFKKHFNKAIKAVPYNFYGKNYLRKGTTPLAERFFGNGELVSDDMKRYLVHSNYFESTISSLTKPFYDQTEHLDDVTRMQYIDMNLILPGNRLNQIDKLSMAHSLEIRLPYLDKEVFEIASMIPVNYRISKGMTKYVLRKAMKNVVPGSIDRPQLEDQVPLSQWLKTNQIHSMLDQIRDSGIHPFLNMDEIEHIMLKHKNNQGDYSRMIWLLYNFALWHKMYMVDLPKS
ncbi:asparagine synthase (glutamine-hydrolyzing) [Paenibacillus sp. FSL A5-0031]|uniref:asparagine synthase (glutamine-hydrolyzing) n=1 Tax=Paenibacillus sp. FSL A5-0031 TaxID=1920420 RepID=UPI00096EB7D7|nr:asparagine synthase (glutamine-hydrolyzing) [Paenibacillus sp. FSL A5-0031]OME78698.1 asparagine synthase (glutamine-hydrolyzing) [Paenibacillus sp. FSL A5-0031]